MSKKILQAAAGNAGESLYVEDVFSTYLYAGNGASQTITNGIDLAGEGGLVWIKGRDDGAHSHCLYDTERGVTKQLNTNYSSAETITSSDISRDFSSFNSNGFSLGEPWNTGNINSSAMTKIASWTFRKAEKFFDIQTWTGDGTGARTISHSLNGTVGSLILKRTDNSSSWSVYHKSLGVSQTLLLENTTGSFGASGRFGSSAPTTNTFDINDIYNVSGATYVAYLFASDAGGFGDDGSESIIKCGSYTGNGTSGHLIDTGFEPQWVLIKRTDASTPWYLVDNMRNMGNKGATNLTSNYLFPNESWSEDYIRNNYVGTHHIEAKPTGFAINPSENDLNRNGNNYIYIAIRRPMKTPESGTEVFQALSYVGTGNVAENRVIDNSGKNGYDSVYFDWRYSGSTSQENIMFTRLSGRALHVNSYNADYPFSQYDASIDSSVGFKTTGNTFNLSGQIRLAHGWRRRPKVHDVVTWKGNGSSSSVDHSLTVSPEIILLWSRENYAGRQVFSSHISNWGKSGDLSGNYAWGNQSNLITNIGEASFTANSWANASNINYVAMLFSTLDGVSKCGSYYGNNGTQSIDCGFSNGPRYIMIRRTDSGNNEGITTSNWWIWDYVRGINAGSEPALSYNSDSAEISSDAIDPTSSGFTVTQEATNAINTSGGTYIFLAIA